MSLSPERRRELDHLCETFRRDVLTVLHKVQTGHPGGSLSVCEILTALYFEKAQVDPKNPKWPQRDRIVLCKGHAAPMLYRILAEKGFFPLEDLQTLRQFGSHLQGHPCSLSTPGIEVSSGPLGVSFPAALGITLANRLSGIDAYTYAILGDGECNEGIVWECAMSAAKFQADHLIAILDWNKVQLDGTADQVMPIHNFPERWAAFGWNVLSCPGHDLDALCAAIDLAKDSKGKPTIIIADTIKGKGVDFMEGKNVYHGKPLTDEEIRLAIAQLGGESK